MNLTSAQTFWQVTYYRKKTETKIPEVILPKFISPKVKKLISESEKTEINNTENQKTECENTKYQFTSCFKTRKITYIQ